MFLTNTQKIVKRCKKRTAAYEQLVPQAKGRHPLLKKYTKRKKIFGLFFFVLNKAPK